MKLKMLFDRILVKVLDDEFKTPSGIALPQEEGSLKRGIVEEVPMGNSDCLATFSVGEKVVFEKHVAIFFTLNNQKYAILKEIDILAKIEGEEK